MNTVPVPGWKFTAYFAVASCHSVSNHVMHMTGLFCRHLLLLQLRFIGCRRSRFQLPLLRELGLGSGFRIIVAHSPVAPHRIEFTFRLLRASLLRTGSSLPVALHGRISPPQLLSATGLLTLTLRG